MSGELILVTSNRFVTTMARIFRQSVPMQKITLCRTLDDTWEIIDDILEKEDARVQ
jgi:hypothetical protein